MARVLSPRGTGGTTTGSGPRTMRELSRLKGVAPEGNWLPKGGPGNADGWGNPGCGAYPPCGTAGKAEPGWNVDELGCCDEGKDPDTTDRVKYATIIISIINNIIIIIYKKKKKKIGFTWPSS